ncbi:unnamed protein product [Camellia sinensis]
MIEEIEPFTIIDELYAALQGKEADTGSELNMDDNVTPFAKAGFFSRLSFWWLNPLLKKGKEKILEDKYMPKLRQKDRAETCYFMFVLTLATGPLLLKAFIEVGQGKERFKYEGYAITVAFFLTKCLESLSERQWYFQTRLIGLQVRSFLSVAIYKMQLRLSNAAKTSHSPGEITNYVTVDAYRIGEFPYWFHQLWTTTLQICLAFLIIYYSMGLATIAAVFIIILAVLGNYPMAKLQHKQLRKLMVAQDKRLKTITETLTSMKVLKLYAWENHFKNVIERLRRDEYNYLSAVLSQRGYAVVLFVSSLTIASAVTFWACYFLRISLNSSNVFTFLATLRIFQEPIRLIPQLGTMFIETKVSFTHIVKFLEAPELQNRHIKQKCDTNEELKQSILINSTQISWDASSLKPTLTNINLVVQFGEKIAVCGEVGSGKSTLIATILGEVPKINGIVQVYGKIAYVSQTTWIQTGTIQENILFGSNLDQHRYQEVLEKCSLIKDLELLPFGDCTIIGERGVNLSGGQKQWVQLVRALYQDADVYLLDDPFSAVDAHTATSLFNLMSEGKIVEAATYNQLLAHSQQFQNLVNAHKDTASSEKHTEYAPKSKISTEGIQEGINTEEQLRAPLGDQLIKKEERETGDTGLKPYIQYLNHSKGFLYLSLAAILHIIFIIGQFLQSLWLAANVQDSNVTILELILVYSLIGCGASILLLLRSYLLVALGLNTSKSIFFQAIDISFPSTNVLLTLRHWEEYSVSSDLSVVDLELAVKFSTSIGTTLNIIFIFGVLAIRTWPILIVITPVVYITILLQLMRIDGTTKSSVVSHLAESIAGVVTIRAFGEEDRFFSENLQLVDANASPFFHKFSANEWLIQRLEILCAIVLSCSALAMTLFPHDGSKSGFIGMTLSYGLSMNVFLVFSIQSQCLMANSIIAVERLEQYMHIPSEAPEIIQSNRPAFNWPAIGRVEICDLKEPTEGMIVIDDLNISTIGLHDLRSHFGVIPQDPTLFSGSVRYNLDLLEEHSDQEIWEVLEKCQLQEVVQEKTEGLYSSVVQDGSNWSMGQRQLFCLGRALLKRRKILVLDEATASIDNATDSIIQKTIRTKFDECTVITVAHRIPTVMDCTMVLTISDGQLVECDEPMKLMSKEESLFGQLVKEYWSHSGNVSGNSEALYHHESVEDHQNQTSKRPPRMPKLHQNLNTDQDLLQANEHGSSKTNEYGDESPSMEKISNDTCKVANGLPPRRDLKELKNSINDPEVYSFSLMIGPKQLSSSYLSSPYASIYNVRVLGWLRDQFEVQQ